MFSGELHTQASFHFISVCDSPTLCLDYNQLRNSRRLFVSHCVLSSDAQTQDESRPLTLSFLWLTT